ncbi:MAG: alanine racemase [Halieaceae bacterium]|nr:alanine racemase [Halieaceae bacterium]
MEPYASLSRALDSAGRAHPTLLIDANRLDANLQRLKTRQLPQSLRLVVKSLPSLPLLDTCMAVLDTRRLMSFHAPFLAQLLERYQDVDILLGKPLPAAAVRQLLTRFRMQPERLEQVQWLVDSEQRLAQYRALAEELGLTLRIAVEINVGLQRGGLDQPQRLATLAAAIDGSAELRFTGLMGYDAHTAKAPGGPARALAAANRRYRDFLAVCDRAPDSLTLNGAGSPTHVLHDRDSPLNDVSLGSVLLKPADFDLPQLAEYQPACWIATPVLKRQPGVSVPFLSAWTRLTSRLPGQRRDSLFLYGGRWMAKPDWPRGMAPHALYGLSSNQQLMTVPARSEIAVDDWAFFRPTQSEAVLLQFGDLQVARDGVLREQWPVLRN